MTSQNFTPAKTARSAGPITIRTLHVRIRWEAAEPVLTNQFCPARLENNAKTRSMRSGTQEKQLSSEEWLSAAEPTAPTIPVTGATKPTAIWWVRTAATTNDAIAVYDAAAVDYASTADDASAAGDAPTANNATAAADDDTATNDGTTARVWIHVTVRGRE